jgi:hypothetical protein
MTNDLENLHTDERFESFEMYSDAAMKQAQQDFFKSKEESEELKKLKPKSRSHRFNNPDILDMMEGSFEDW